MTQLVCILDKYNNIIIYMLEIVSKVLLARLPYLMLYCTARVPVSVMLYLHNIAAAKGTSLKI